MKSISGGHIVLMVIIFCIAAAAGLRSQSGIVIIENTSHYRQKERGPVLFPHEKHFTHTECTRCHHRYIGGLNVLDMEDLRPGKSCIRCVYCHTEKSSHLRTREAYHTQCMGCHRQRARQDKKTGPRMCAQCHPQ